MYNFLNVIELDDHRLLWRSGRTVESMVPSFILVSIFHLESNEFATVCIVWNISLENQSVHEYNEIAQIEARISDKYGKTSPFGFWLINELSLQWLKPYKYTNIDLARNPFHLLHMFHSTEYKMQFSCLDITKQSELWTFIFKRFILFCLKKRKNV